MAFKGKKDNLSFKGKENVQESKNLLIKFNKQKETNNDLVINNESNEENLI
jgi:hypothetical protein